MSAPLSLLPACYVLIDGVRYADGQPGEPDDAPALLTDLTVTWGRDNSLDQPEPGTCTMTVLDVPYGVRFQDTMHIGSRVDVIAAATIYPDPTVSTITDPGFEAAAGLAGPVAGCAPVISTDKPRTGAKSVKVNGTGPYPSLIFPPAPYGGVSAWDAIPRTKAGQTWKYGASVWLGQVLVGVQVGRVRPVAFTRPAADAHTVLNEPLTTAPGASGWLTLLGDFVPPEGVWLGLAVDFVPVGPEWDEIPAGITWDSVAPGLRWDDVGQAFIDDLVVLAPAAGALRSGTVFSGRVTDIEARYELGAGGMLIDITAETHLAELNNRYVGDVPWPAERLDTRFAKIVAASGQTVQSQIDASVAGKQISYRDVDNQPSGRLLHELAQSVGGALWSAASQTSGTFIWLEDIDNRPTMFILAMGTDGLVHIVLRPTVPDRSIQLDACDVLLEPVRWSQTTEDNATRVVVSWQEQTVDDEGQPDPTDRDETADDPAAEAATGRRRIQISTQLATQLDAQHVADSVLARTSAGALPWRVGGLTWRAEAAERLDANTLGRIMTILDGVTRLGLGIQLVNLPDWSPVKDLVVPLFLEGATFRNLDGAWELDLLTSSARAQGRSDVAWDDLPGSAPVRTNRAPNPRAVSTGSDGWRTSRGFGAGGAGSYSFGTGQTGPAGTGITTTRRKTWTTAPSSNADSGYEVRATEAAYHATTPGDVLAISIWFRHTSATTKIARPRLQYFNQINPVGAGPIGGTVEGADVTVSPNVWTRLGIVTTVPAGAASVTVYPDIMVGGAGLWAVGNVLDATGLMIEKAGAVGSYFDGATTDAPLTDFGWAGTANASSSTATDLTGWSWDEFAPEITWNALQGVDV